MVAKLILYVILLLITVELGSIKQSHKYMIEYSCALNRK